MKKILLGLVCFLALSAHADIGPNGRSTNLKYDGTIDTSTVENRFVNVLNGTGGTLAAGTVVTWDLTADDSATITTSASAGQSPVCIIAKSCTTLKLCSCQRKGKVAAALFDSTGNNAVAGSRWYMSSANAGYVSARGTSLATEVPGGIFFDAASASGTIDIYIDL
jgi:hypothetical protein